jgi:CRISPR/Cas system CSM-associated protein Csm5 (group 7 of RAMP superfamily)
MIIHHFLVATLLIIIGECYKPFHKLIFRNYDDNEVQKRVQLSEIEPQIHNQVNLQRYLPSNWKNYSNGTQNSARWYQNEEQVSVLLPITSAQVRYRRLTWKYSLKKSRFRLK